MQGLLNSLRSRRIDRVAAVYAVAGWALVQAASIALPAFGAPIWALRAFIALAVVGLPVTLAIAWVAAPHPHLRKGRLPPATRHTDLALLATLAIVLTAIIVQCALLFLWPTTPSVKRVAAAAASVAPAPRAANDVSIAVLPFTSLSTDPSNRYFSDGISAELIMELSQVRDLRVAARASSFSFQSKNVDIRTIARTLGVHSVLDGSVRVEGPRVRIEAELSSDDGFMIWSQSYDGDLTHILDLQDEIARAITGALTHRLLARNDMTGNRPASINPEAYRQYLEGRYYLAQRTEVATAKAIALFERVTQLQPDFVDGFAALARAYSASVFNLGHRQYIGPGEIAIQNAFRLDPHNTEALMAHSALSLDRWDWSSAAADLRKMRALDSSSSEMLSMEAVLLKNLGFPDQSLSAARASAKLDPLFPVAWANIASSLFELGRYDEASSAAAYALALLPGLPDILVEQCGAYAHTAHVAEAQAIAAALVQSGEDKHADGCRFEIALVSGRLVEARRLADRMAQEGDTGAARLRETLGQYYLLVGDTGTAVACFERAYQNKEIGLFTVGLDRSTPRSLFADPGWKALWQKPLMREWQTAHDRLAAELVDSH